jgi:hypothetical protein
MWVRKRVAKGSIGRPRHGRNYIKADFKDKRVGECRLIHLTGGIFIA